MVNPQHPGSLFVPAACDHIPTATSESAADLWLNKQNKQGFQFVRARRLHFCRIMSIALLLIHNAKSLLPTTSPLPCLSARGGHATTSSVSSSASACRQCSDKHHHRHQGINPRKRVHFCGPLRLLQRLGTERTRGEHWSNLERSGVNWKPKGAAADSHTPTWRRMSMQFMPACGCSKQDQSTGQTLALHL